MEFYIVKDENILLSKKLTYNDIVFILDGRAGYIWKGQEAKDLDELTAKKIDQIIKETFDQVVFGLISDLDIKNTDNKKIIQIKSEIIKRLPRQITSKIKKKKAGFINSIKAKILEFKNYENSWKWRKKLSNLTNLWKLSIFNIVIIAFCIVLMFNQTIFHTIIGDYFLLMALILLSIIFLVNCIFIIFPMKFPIGVLSIGGVSVDDKLPPKPKTPPSPGKKKIPKKQTVKQIQLAPLKVSNKKQDKIKSKEIVSINGGEYLSEEDLALGVPAIPEAPKKIKNITLNSSDLSTHILDRVKELESPKIRVVLVNCERCKSIIPVPVPKQAVLKSKLPVVPISYIHKNLKNKDEHCLTIYIDHDFDIRRQRISEAVLAK